MNRIQRFSTAMVVIFGLFALGAAAVAAPVAKHHNHHDGKQLVGDNLKHDGHHDIDHKGKYTTSVEVKNGKIAAVHVKHSEKGNIPVKKYKTNKKMAQAGGHTHASLLSVQYQDMGTVYIGYAYIDDDGNEEIYWFPYDMIVDGDTGAVEYIAES
jgi:major membrane immunogen (membrane-anchored lipoprotein)